MNVEEIFYDISYFKIKKLISKGNFANYYIAKNRENQAKYAAKIYIIDDQVTSSDQIDVLREAMILNKLHHPSIIGFYGVNYQSYDDPLQIRPSILLDYYPNGSLRKIIDKEKKGASPSTWNATKKYINLLGISHAMKYIHQEGIIHRNLKPENILLDENYYPIISDFILSRTFPFPLKKSFQIPFQNQFGTPLYMAPELAFEDEFYGTGVDVYAFSMIAYELLTGKMPGFETGLAFSILRFHRPFYRPLFPKNVTEKMKELILKCSNAWPDERPSFSEIYDELSNDFSYFGGDFDVDEVKNYIEMIERAGNSKFENEELGSDSSLLENEEGCNNESHKMNDQKSNKTKTNKSLLEINDAKIDDGLSCNISQLEIEEINNKQINKSQLEYDEMRNNDLKIDDENLHNNSELINDEINTSNLRCIIDEYSFVEDDFFLVSKICQNDFSVDSKVVEKKTKKPFLRKDFKCECVNIQNLIKEFELLYSLHHPCICQLHAFHFHENSDVSILSEFVDFKLKDCLNFSIINNTLKIRIIVEILHGMIYLHRNGLVCRNFDIDNIMLNSVFHAKINFGFSQFNECLLKRKSGNINDVNSSVYSFGLVLYSIFMGDKNMKCDMKNITNGKFTSVITECCIELISKCLLSNPKDRPSFEEILKCLRENNYLLSYDADPTIILQRDQEIELFKD